MKRFSCMIFFIFLTSSVSAQTATQNLNVIYKSFFDPSYVLQVSLNGAPVGDKVLIQDILTGLEKQEKIHGQEMFFSAAVELVNVQENNEVFIEKWTVDRGSGLKDYWVTIDTTPPSGFPYKIMINISESGPDVSGISGVDGAGESFGMQAKMKIGGSDHDFYDVVQLHERGEIQQAITKLKSLEQQDPDDTTIWLYLGQFYFEAKDFKSAVAYFARLSHRFPQNEEVLVLLGETYLHLKQYREAEYNFERALAIDPTWVDVYVLLSTAKRGLGEYEEAMEYVSQALEKDPQKPLALLELGMVYQELGDFDKAYDALVRAKAGYETLGETVNVEFAEKGIQDVLRSKERSTPIGFLEGQVEDFSKNFKENENVRGLVFVVAFWLMAFLILPVLWRKYAFKRRCLRLEKIARDLNAVLEPIEGVKRSHRIRFSCEGREVILEDHYKLSSNSRSTTYYYEPMLKVQTGTSFSLELLLSPENSSIDRGMRKMVEKIMDCPEKISKEGFPERLKNWDVYSNDTLEAKKFLSHPEVIDILIQKKPKALFFKETTTGYKIRNGMVFRAFHSAFITNMEKVTKEAQQMCFLAQKIDNT